MVPSLIIHNRNSKSVRPSRSELLRQIDIAVAALAGNSSYNSHSNGNELLQQVAITAIVGNSSNNNTNNSTNSSNTNNNNISSSSSSNNNNNKMGGMRWYEE